MKNMVAFVMGRNVNGKIIYEQCRASSAFGAKQVIRSYKMAGMGWDLADLPCNDLVRKLISGGDGDGQKV